MKRIVSSLRLSTAIGACVAILIFASAPTLGAFSLAAQEIRRLEVAPESIELRGRRDAVQLVVTLIESDGSRRDVTRDVEFADSSLIEVDELQGRVTGLSDGSGEWSITYGDLETRLPVEVSESQHVEPISFRWETLAVLTKQGCNSGGCHGKPNGRGALELSLNAFDPKFDARHLTRGARVRFTDRLVPRESLLLAKPTLAVPHTGGQRLEVDDPLYNVLAQWIEEGCQVDAEEAPVCMEVQVEPTTAILLDPASAAQQQLRITAKFSDGSVKDVTSIATWTVSHASVATVDAHGLVSAVERGQAAVSVRYLDDLVSVPVIVVRDIPGYEWPAVEPVNQIDSLVYAKLQQLRFVPSPPCDDSTFLRRSSLDVRGVLPTVAEVEEFLSDPAVDRRDRWIDRLLESNEYAAFWSLKQADLLRIGTAQTSPERAAAFAEWVRNSVASNQPYDQFCRELLTASGSTTSQPAAEFYRVTSETKMVAETVAQVFLGSRIQCAQCHNHPQERWTQDNYYQIAAAFHQVDRRPDPQAEPVAGGDPKGQPLKIELATDRTLANPRTEIVQAPWPTEVKREPGSDYRIAFADWLVQKGNPYFARVAVNRMWAELFGSGLVEPVDDFRSSNPAVNSELLDALAIELENSGFDRKAMLRMMLQSATYQASADPLPLNVQDQRLGSHALVRRLSAEQLHDAIVRFCDGDLRSATLEQQAESLKSELVRLESAEGSNETEGVATRIAELKQQLASIQKQRREVYMTQQPYPLLTPFLTAFGQPERMSACACEREGEVSLSQALQLITSPLVRDQVSGAARRLALLEDDELIEQIYMAAMSRRSVETEQQTIRQYLASSNDRTTAVEDLMWSLINTNEFLFQH